MKVMIDKVTLWILLGVIGITALVVIVLQSMHPPIMAEVRLTCEQVNFDVIRPEDTHQPISLLNSGLWISQAKVSVFDHVLFKAPPSIEATDLAHLCDGTEVSISPTSSNSYVKLVSSEEAFSLSDIFIGSVARISWGVEDASLYILIENTEGQSPGEISASFSTGDILYLGVFNCAFLNRVGQPLYETARDVEEDFVFPVSFSRAQANVISDTGPLEVSIEMQPESFMEKTEILKDLKVRSIDYSKKEYSGTGHATERTTVLAGIVKRPTYSLDDSVRIQKGYFINTVPAEGHLESLRPDSSLLEASIKYDVRSMKIGPDPTAEHELVKSRLLTLLNNQTLIIIYTIAMALFGVITKFLVKRKREEN